MNVGVFDEGKVAGAAGDRRVNFILDTSRRRTGADAQITVSRIGVIRNEDQIRTTLDRQTRQFGEFDVVTDLDRDFAAVRVKNFQRFSTLDTPPVSLRRRDMQFVLAVDMSIAVTEKSDVKKFFILQDKMRSGHQVDIVGD